MRPPLSQPPALPETWAHVLDDVAATLREAERAATQRSQAISHFAPSSVANRQRDTSWHQSLERLEKQLQGWPAVLRLAENEASLADDVLKAQEEALRHWLSEADALEQRLAKWVAPEV